ncbi:MAG: hypothetical protein ACI9VR_002797 [Cognaticolwellia sp.]
MACAQPDNSAEQGGDCEDLDAGVNPGAQEICDDVDVDEDCDGDADDADDSVDSAGFSSFYEDVDGDGFGDATQMSLSCDAGSAQVDNDLDCGDADAEIGEECRGWDGVYTGTFQVNAVVAGIGITDTCTGTANIEVVQANDTQIIGVVECSFSGALASVFAGGWDANITGDVGSDDSAQGELELVEILTDVWEGGFVGNTLTGNISGNTTYESYKVSYTGGFEVIR